MKNTVTKWISLLFCTVLVSILLIACGTDSTNNGSTTLSQATPTSTPTPTPTPTPTVKEYADEDYTLSYPLNWKTEKKNGQLQIVSPDGIAIIVQAATSPSGEASLEGAVSGGLNAFKSQATNAKDETVEQKRTINGVEWYQGSASGDLKDSSGTNNIRVLLLAAKHPTAKGKFVLLILSVESKSFDKANKEYFEPLVQSFKFK